MREFIKDQEQLTDLLSSKGASSFFIDNFHYHDFLNCISDNRKIIKEGVSSKLIEKYYVILNELSNFLHRFSSTYNFLQVTDLSIKNSDEYYINVICEFRGSIYAINFEFEYEYNEGEWKICDMFFRREINVCDGLIVADNDNDDIDEFYSICCLVAGTDKTDNVEVYIKDTNVMEIIKDGIADQLNTISNEFSKIAAGFKSSVSEFM